MIKITNAQKKDFMEELRYVSSFGDSDSATIRGKARAAEHILILISWEPSGEIKSEYTEQEWECIKDLVKCFKELNNHHLQRYSDEFNDCFRGMISIITWLLNAMKLVEEGSKDLFPWAM